MRTSDVVRASQPGSSPHGYVDETVAAYDVGAEAYARRYADVDLAEYLERFVAAQPVTEGPVLDAGCGSGRDLVRFGRLGVRAVGLDRSSGMLAVVHRVKPAARVVQADLRCLPFHEMTFTGVWHCASLLHLAPTDAFEALLEVHRVLRPGGVLFLSVARGSGGEWRTGSLGGRRWFQYYERGEIETIVRSAHLKVNWSAAQRGVVHGTWVNVFAERLA